MAIVFIGCDMGSWLGTNDACAVCRFEKGRLSNEYAQDGRLFYPLHEEVQRFVTSAIENPEHRVVIGIDAALAWPTRFTSLVNSAPNMTHLPNPALDPTRMSQIDNPYLFRETERFIRRACLSKDPLTAVGDKFGNNTTKAQILAASFRSLCSTSSHQSRVYRPPFDCWDCDTATAAQVTIIEVYPTASRTSRVFGEMMWPGTRKTPLRSLDKTDVSDAKICSMTALCYALTVGLISHEDLASCDEIPACPEVFTPDDYTTGPKATLQSEGWIFAPKDTEGVN